VHAISKKRVIKNIVAGVAFIFGAMNVINGEEAILEVIKKMKDSHRDMKRIHFHKTCPGDRHLTKELLSIVEEFEKAIGKEIVNEEPCLEINGKEA